MWMAVMADNARFGQLIVTQTGMTVGGDAAEGLSHEGWYLVQCDIIVPRCNCVFNGEIYRMSTKPAVLQRSDWAVSDDEWRGRFEGKDIGTNVTVLFFSSDDVGDGPPLHVHPYDEVFVVRQGKARFTIGDEVIEAEAGQILLAPADTPHKFETVGPGRFETTDIHLSAEFSQTNLE